MTTTEPRGPFAKRGFILAAIVVGVIGLVAVVVLIVSLTRAPSPNAEPSTTPSAPPPSGEPTAGNESICGLSGFETENNLRSAPETDWELVGTVAAPTDPTGAGPGDIDDGLRTCYAHTAEGALYMAVNYVAMGTDALLYDRLPALVAPGPGRDALEDAANDGPSDSSTRAQVAGYTINGYSAQSVTVDLALLYSGGQLLSLPLKLVWAEGDWKVQMTDTGELPVAPAPIDNLGGYTPWSGA